MGKVRPFCRSGLVASILRPYCGLKPKNSLQLGELLMQACNMLGSKLKTMIHFLRPHNVNYSNR